MLCRPDIPGIICAVAGNSLVDGCRALILAKPVGSFRTSRRRTWTTLLYGGAVRKLEVFIASSISSFGSRRRKRSPEVAGSSQNSETESDRLEYFRRIYRVIIGELRTIGAESGVAPRHPPGLAPP